MIKSLNAFTPAFTDEIRSNPDIYGAIWIVVIFSFLSGLMMKMSSLLGNGFGSLEGGDVFIIDKIGYSYAFILVITLLLYIICHCIERTGLDNVNKYDDINWAHFICIYGYSFTINIVVLPLLMIPNIYV